MEKSTTMSQFSQQQVARLLRLCEDRASRARRGQALEALMCHLLETIPGMRVYARDHRDFAQSQEIDIALWNDRLHFLPSVILVECKNWNSHVGSVEIRAFEGKLRDRGLPFGILVAPKGIAGNPTELTSAHNVVSGALRDGIRIIVLTRTDIESVISGADLEEIFKTKLCELAVSRTSL